ncbi:hypothetical protein Cp4436_01445 [Clostridium perfringens]|nr:hypothetical protein [Clostridium perfringens]
MCFCNITFKTTGKRENKERFSVDYNVKEIIELISDIILEYASFEKIKISDSNKEDS